MNNDPKQLTLGEACEFLNLKKSRLYNLVFRRKIPFLKIGASIRFDKNDLVQWLKKQKQDVVNG